MLSVPGAQRSQGQSWVAGQRSQLRAVLAAWLISGAIVSFVPEKETEAQLKDVFWKKQMSQAGKPSQLQDSEKNESEMCMALVDRETGFGRLEPGLLSPALYPQGLGS